mmetsp:Transcript_17172/g.26017  ORF Transcript_17172/g.26017 Transcript_17172/m.26017 type:complete len:191 (-) Transcript_17172:403-975(-)
MKPNNILIAIAVISIYDHASGLLQNHRLKAIMPISSEITVSKESSYSSANVKLSKLKAVTKSQNDHGNSPAFTLKKGNPYDVHVYYSNEDQRREAMELRDKMKETFQWMRFYSPKDRPIGPHPVPMWEADFGSYENRYRWTEVRKFIEEEHGNLSVLIHPHSLDGDYADHTRNAFWAVNILELRIGGWKR